MIHRYAHHGNIALQWEAKFEPPYYGAVNRPEPAGKCYIFGGLRLRFRTL